MGEVEWTLSGMTSGAAARAHTRGSEGPRRVGGETSEGVRGRADEPSAPHSPVKRREREKKMQLNQAEACGGAVLKRHNGRL